MTAVAKVVAERFRVTKSTSRVMRFFEPVIRDPQGHSKAMIDVLELLKLGKVSVEEVTKRLSGKARADDLEQFQALVQIAKLEVANNPKAARRRLVAMLATGK